jgi:hypothetical protein
MPDRWIIKGGAQVKARQFAVAVLLGAFAACGMPRWARAAEPAGQEVGRHAPFNSPGEKAQTSMFGIDAEGAKSVYVIDRSGSMGIDGDRPLAAAKAELLRSIEKLDTVQQFQIIFYNERPRTFNPTGVPGRLAFGSEGNKAEVHRFLDTVKAEGGTDHEAAVMTAIRMRPDVIFLVTDGDDPQLDARQLARIERMGAGIIIHAIQFGTGPQQPRNFMAQLARQSAGRHVYVDVSKLPAADAAK